MVDLRRIQLICATIAACTGGVVLQCAAGGSGLNTVVVVNQASSNSLAIGNHYAYRRGVPAQNVVRIEWTGGRAEWSRQDFQTRLLNPLAAALITRGLTGQVDTAVLSVDIPYRVIESNGVNSTTSVLFYGFRADGSTSAGLPLSCSLPAVAASAYALTEEPFRAAGPGRVLTNLLAFMLAGDSPAALRQWIDRTVSADGTFPTNPVILQKTGDLIRSSRHTQFDNAIFEARVLGAANLLRVDSSSTTFSNVLGLCTGLEFLQIAPETFVPGALADHLTSYGGYLYEATYQTNILALLRGGAAASYGTVIEPCAHTEKFPDPAVYFLQSRGFNAAESYYQSLRSPHQGLLAGDPLAAPFARPGQGVIIRPHSGATLGGVADLEIQFSAADATRPLETFELYANGLRLQVLTNILANRSNPVTVNLNGHAVTYTSTTNATARGLARGVAAMLNQTANQTNTRCTAIGHGDRIELRLMDTNTAGFDVPVSVSLSGSPPVTASIRAARSTFLDSPAYARREFHVQGSPSASAVMSVTVTKPAGSVVTVAVTNNGAGLSSFLASFAGAINSAPGLSGPDGLICEDLLVNGTTAVDYALRARAPGRARSNLSVRFSASGSIAFSTTASVKLDENLADLHPRNHLYFAVGVTNMTGGFAFDTRLLPDGFHELAVVATEGSHIRTQTRAVVPVMIRNHSLQATLHQTDGGSPAGLGAMLKFSVLANTPDVATIELHSTGGWIAAVPGQAAVDFAVPAAHFGAGHHAFHALVTDVSGRRYRTAPIRLEISEDPSKTPFPIAIRTNPLRLSWSAIPSGRYRILTAATPDRTFTLLTNVTAGASGGETTWTDPAPDASRRFYRIALEPTAP